MRTVESLGATLEMRESTACKAGEVPTISSNIDALLISSRRATFSCCSLSSACLRSSISVQATYQRTTRSEEHTSELQSHLNLVCRLLLEKKNKTCTDHSHLTLTD